MFRNRTYYLLLFSLLVWVCCGRADDGGDPGGDPNPPPPPPADEKYYVSSVAELNALSLGAGDTVVWRRGTYSGQQITFAARGTSSAPVVLMGEKGGETVFTGSSRVTLTGNYAVIKDLWFRDPVSTAGQAVITFANNTTGCRATGCAITGANTDEDKSTDYKWVSLYGTGHAVERCTFVDKKNMGALFVVWMNAAQVPGHKISNNYFSRPTALTDNGSEINGQETIRIGTSDYSLGEGGCTVEGNRFYRCDAEAEIISNKSCGNVYRNNLFTECQGTLTLRHGNRCTVEENLFLGNGVSNTGGVRVIGEDHTVRANHLEKLRGSGYKTGICLVRGQSNPALSGYAQVKNCVVESNVLVDCAYAFHLNYGSNTDQVMPVVSTRIENNTVTTSSSSDYTVYLRTPPVPEITWNGNTIYGGRQSGESQPTVSSAPQPPSVAEKRAAIEAAAGATWIL